MVQYWSRDLYHHDQSNNFCRNSRLLTTDLIRIRFVSEACSRIVEMVFGYKVMLPFVAFCVLGKSAPGYFYDVLTFNSLLLCCYPCARCGNCGWTVFGLLVLLFGVALLVTALMRLPQCRRGAARYFLTYRESQGGWYLWINLTRQAGFRTNEIVLFKAVC